MKNLLKCSVFFLVVTWALSIHSQVLPTFTNGTATYTEMTDGIPIYKDSIWDDIEGDSVPIGFGFENNGKVYTHFYIRDGYLEIGDFSIGFFADLLDRGNEDLNSPKSPITYKTSGSVGARLFTIQWKNFGFFDEMDVNETQTDFGNLQMIVSEKDNSISLLFGPSSIAGKLKPSYLEFIGVACFIGEELSGKFIGLNGSYSNPTVINNLLIFNGLNRYPAVGTSYQFKFAKNSGTNRLASVGNENKMYYFQNAIYIKNTVQSNAQFSISDLNGKSIYSGVAKNKIDLTELNRGVYVFSYNNQSFKFVKD